MADRGFIYKVWNSDIFVSNRAFQDGHDPWLADAYLSVTDTFVQPPENRIFVWHPWNELKKPTPENYYACNRVLHWWIMRQEIKKIRLFCDAGTHRSVTIFGIFLLTYFPDHAEQIVKSRKHVEIEDDYTWSNPLDYARKYLLEFPEDHLFLRVMSDDTLLRLDYICREMEGRMKTRFGIFKE